MLDTQALTNFLFLKVPLCSCQIEKYLPIKPNQCRLEIFIEFSLSNIKLLEKPATAYVPRHGLDIFHQEFIFLTISDSDLGATN